jgi:hypothetical protein
MIDETLSRKMLESLSVEGKMLGKGDIRLGHDPRLRLERN